MKYLSSVIFSLLFLILFGCSDEVPRAKHPIEGNWEWQQSFDLNGNNSSPATEGFTLQLSINENIVTNFQNDSLTNVRGYVLQERNSIHGGIREMIVYEDSTRQSFEVDGSNLRLINECQGCNTSLYRRTN